ncbi:MAG TPA: S8 family peptidase, partial [Pseudobdellovibrionaceae bacterium]|nr:S8 family peptidase [Pseudobdellovibrionaceae bacterium]
ALNTAEIPDNGIGDDKNGVVDDYAGAVFISKTDNTNDPLPDHGTHVAGIIAANPHSGSLSGVAPAAKILPAQFLSRSGSGLLSDALRAMKYLEGRNVQVLNASWGGSPCVKSMRDAMQRLSDKGVVLVVASGNAGQDLDRSPEFPAAFNLANQLTVAASTDLDYMTSWSNSSFNLVHLAAPGDGILSTTANNRTGTMSGTSMATPFVAGAAALLKSAFPKATPAQIKNAIMNSVDVRSGHEFRVQSRGRLNVERALASLRSFAQ